MKKEEFILVAIKRPGNEPYVNVVKNDLKTFQDLVGGYIESFTVSSGLTILCNEEGLLEGLPYNETIFGNPFVGTIVAVGVDGEEFSSLKSASVPTVLKLLGGE